MSILSRDLAAAEPVHIIERAAFDRVIQRAPKNLPVCERGEFFWLLYCAIAIVRLRWHVIIIHNNIHIRIEPAGILQKIRV